MKAMRIFFVIGVGLVLLSQTSCSTQWRIKHYSGDGNIKTIPTPFFVHDGYTVQFKPVKLDHSTRLTYHFKGLPKIAWRVDVFFEIDDPRLLDDKERYDLKGTLAMSLKDSKGNLIMQFEHKLSELVWSRGSGPWELYDEEKPGFTADSTVEYTLEVTIDPDSALKDDKGYVLFSTGGFGK